MKKELLSCFMTHNEDYLVLVKWCNHGRIFSEKENKYIRGDEWVVAYSWNPCDIPTGESEWIGAKYFTNPVEAYDHYLKQVKKEDKELNHYSIREEQ